jgi:hypothetical protein
MVWWVPTGLAQVSFSSRPGTDPAVRLAPREPVAAEAEPAPISLPKETSFLPDWRFFPDGAEIDADKGARSSAGSRAPLQIGDVTFNQMAESVNAWKTGPAKADDLSRQFQPKAGASGLMGAVPTGAWLVLGIAVFAVLFGLVLGQYESDQEARKRHKRRHHHRHRHRSSEEQGDLPGQGSA